MRQPESPGQLVGECPHRYTRQPPPINFQENRYIQHMRKILTSFAVGYVLLAVGAMAQQSEKAATQSKPLISPQEKTGPSPKKSKAADKADAALKVATPTEAEKLLDDAIEKVQALQQYKADVRQVTEMLGYTIRADGRYAIGRDFRLLLELKVQLTNTSGSMKEVCDGKKHWRSKQVLDSQELTTLDVGKVRQIIEKPEFNKDIRDELIRRFGFSGIVPFMRAIRDTQKLEEHEDATLDGTDIPVYVLRGVWREDAIGQATIRGQPLSLSNLPPYIPDKSTVWIGRENGWPYRMKLETTKKFQGGVTSVTVEFLNPEIDVDLPDSLFEFQPPAGVAPLDQTELLVQQLTAVLRQAEQATQKEKAPSGGAGSTPSKPQSAPAKSPLSTVDGPSANAPKGK